MCIYVNGVDASLAYVQLNRRHMSWASLNAELKFYQTCVALLGVPNPKLSCQHLETDNTCFLSV